MFPCRSVSFVETLVALNDYVYGFFSSVKSLPSEVLRYVLQCFDLLIFFCDSCGTTEDFICCFLFAASETSLRFWMLLVVENASCVSSLVYVLCSNLTF